MIKYLLLTIIGISVGVSIFLFINPAAMVATQNFLAPIFTPIIIGITNIANVIPSPIKQILGIISIPSIISGVFFAWTKVKAMQKLNETEQMAKQQVTNLSGQVTGAQGTAEVVSEGLATKIQSLTSERDSYKVQLQEKETQITTLTGNLESSSQIRIRREEDIRHLTRKIKELQYQIDVATGKIQLPIK